MSFEQSIIIPVSLFKQCKLEEILNESNNANSLPAPVLNSNLPSDKKMKLYEHRKILQKSHLGTLMTSPSMLDTETIASHIPVSVRPYAVSILEFMKKHSNIVSWDDEFRLKIHGKTYQNSNIKKIIQYL